MQEEFIVIQNHLLFDKNPSLFLETFFQSKNARKEPFFLLEKLKKTKQSPKHHPEGNAWKHTMMVVDYAALLREQSKDAKAFMWASLLHDIGKPETTRIRHGRITSYNHDKIGASLARTFLEYFDVEEEFVEKVVQLVRYHMHILFIVNDLPYHDKYGLIRDSDIDEIALLGYADRMGRCNANEQEVKETIELFKGKMSEFVHVP